MSVLVGYQVCLSSPPGDSNVLPGLRTAISDRMQVNRSVVQEGETLAVRPREVDEQNRWVQNIYKE